MFTGLIQHVGKISTKVKDRIYISCPSWPVDFVLGESIAVNGVCLTVAETTKTGFGLDVGSVTVTQTTVADLGVGAPVNLERSLAVGDRLGGHIVQGHVDGKILLLERQRNDSCWHLCFCIPKAKRPYCILKGSIAIDGVSLTIASLIEQCPKQYKNIVRNFEQYFLIYVMIIPHTMSYTQLRTLLPGDLANVEFDLMAKYAENFFRVFKKECGV